MKPLNYHLLATALIIITFGYASHIAALAEDRNQPINVSADSAQKNDQKGITTYQGDVVITQGSIRITGDEIVIFDKDGKVSEMVAKGKPATFKQRPDGQDEDMIATGDTIKYNIDTEILLMTDNASLKQQGRTTESNNIRYDMKTTIVNAGGSQNGRVIMVLEPSQ